MRSTLFFLTLTVISFAGFGATITGTVKTVKGEILPFSSVLVKKSTLGTTANSNGIFSIELPNGNYTLICQ